MNKNTITCPKCNTIIDVDEVLKHNLEEELREQYKKKYLSDLSQLHEEREKLHIEKAKLEEFKNREREVFQRKLNEQVKQEVEIKEKSIKASQMTIIEELQKKVSDSELEKIRIKQLELELTKQEEIFKSKFELEKTKIELDLRNSLSELIKKEEEEKFEQKNKENEHKLDQQRKLIEDMQRKIEQGSMQTQGEVLEELLEENLRKNFPLDEVVEIKKGEVGADILLNIHHNRLGFCGSIIFECKNTKDWNKDWVEKLKSDQKTKNAHIAIIVSKTFPKDKSKLSFFNEQGIWVSNFKESISLTEVLRAQIIRLKEIEISQQGKGNKSIEMYDYLQSDRFRINMQEIINSFLSMKNEINRERATMEKHWKNRDAMIDKMIANSLDINSQIQAIGGGEIIELPAFEI